MVLHWHVIISLVVIGISLTIVPALAAAPAEIFTFQGLLKNTDGTLVSGQRDITLRIYDIATGGSASSSPGSSCPKGSATHCLWQENQTNIGVANGIFTITAGNQTSLNRINFTNALFLEVIVRTSGGNDQVLSPRINLTSAPFAISAMKATGTNSTSLFNLNQKGIFNATQLFVNQTDSSFTDTIVNITSTGVGTGFNIKTESTVNNVVNITAGSLTTGSALNIGSTSGSTADRSLVSITNDNSAATETVLLKLKQDAAGEIIEVISSEGLTSLEVSDLGTVHIGPLASSLSGSLVVADRADAIHLAINASSSTTNVINVTAGTLSTGSAVLINSGSGDSSKRNLVEIINDNAGATGTTVFSIRQDSTGTIINTQNSTSAEVFKVDNSGLVTATQLKVNTTGTTLKGIFSGTRDLGGLTGGLHYVEVTGAEAGDSATCAITGNLGIGNNAGAVITGIGNITSTGMSIPRLYVNVTNIAAVQGTGGADTLPSPSVVNCIVFDLTSSAP